jgi:NAD-dependent deacetylase
LSSGAIDFLTAELRRDHTFAVFVTGAGISTASGIPTFRGPEPDAVWTRDIMEMATLSFFRSNPAEQWLWYLKRFAGVRSARENPAHIAISSIERALIEPGRRFQLITQNIDGLHARAGTQNLIEVHGAARYVRCSRDGCRNGAPTGMLPFDDDAFAAFRNDPRTQTLPRCSLCNSILRPHVLWFDEYYSDHTSYGFEQVQHVLGLATCVVFVGTSFSVGITEMALQAVRRAALPAWVIDPHMKASPIPRLHLIQHPSEVVLPQVAAAFM